MFKYCLHDRRNNAAESCVLLWLHLADSRLGRVFSSGCPFTQHNHCCLLLLGTELHYIYADEYEYDGIENEEGEIITTNVPTIK